MIILGLLLLLGAVGLSVAAIQANQDLFTGTAGVVELMGRSTEVTIGEVFLGGASAGVIALIGFLMMFMGIGGRARRRAELRRQNRAQQRELRDLQRQQSETHARPQAGSARTEERVAAEEEREEALAGKQGQ